MAQPSLASAVVLPSASPSPPPAAPESPTTNKRSNPDPQTSPSPKRRRTSQSPTNPPETSPPVHPSRARKVSNPPAKPAQDETRDKRRNQRLFGALLGGGATARAPRDAGVAKRRQEQEARRLAAAREREAEIAARQGERLDRLREERRVVQRRVDERGMRIRHLGLRACAGFLKTKAQPALYYLPWKIREEDVEALRVQREEVEAVVDADKVR